MQAKESEKEFSSTMRIKIEPISYGKIAFEHLQDGFQQGIK